MAIKESILADFSGGEIQSPSSSEPAENQWLLLEGFVLDTNRRLRAQWEGSSWLIELAGS
jgi:hypothetical protein